MKKFALSVISVLTLISFNQLTFADTKSPSDLKIEIQPLSAGLKAKAFGVHGTDVSIINYATPYTIHVTSPANVYLYERTSARITSNSAFNPYIIIKDDDDCTLLFSGNVSNYATVSCYYADGRPNSCQSIDNY